MRTSFPFRRVTAAAAVFLFGAITSAASAAAPLDGLWCGTGPLHEFSLRLQQEAQDVQGTLVRRDRVRAITGRLDGATLHTQSSRQGSLVLRLAGDELRITGGDGPLALVAGTSFRRVHADSCAG